MRAAPVADGGPTRDGLSGLIGAKDQGLVRELVPGPAVERDADTVSRIGLPRGDEVPGQTGLPGPFRHGIRREAGVLIAGDETGLAAPRHEAPQLRRHPLARDQGVDHGRETFLRDVVHEVRDMRGRRLMTSASCTDPQARGRLRNHVNGHSLPLLGRPVGEGPIFQ